MSREKRKKEGQEAELALAQEPSEIRVDPIALIKTLMEEQRRNDCAREEARREREERARDENLATEQQAKGDLEAMAAETAKRQSILQEEELARYAEQQAALLRVQAEIGSEAAKVHREEVAASKARDRAIASVTNYKDGEDVQDYLVTTEHKLTAGGVKCEE